MKILAIDPGNEKSAWVVWWDGKNILECKIGQNVAAKEVLSQSVTFPFDGYDVIVIEKLECYGMPVGATVLDTAVWIGRLQEACTKIKSDGTLQKIILVPRKQVKLHLCGSARAKDSNVIQALKDRFEPELQPRMRPKGILKGLKKDEWQAFALAVYVYDFLQGGGNVDEFV